MVEIDSIFKHESFDANTINNDIALIKTKQKIHFTKYVQPVCLPGAKYHYVEGTSAFISGWGNTKQVIPDFGSRMKQHRNSPNVLQAARVPLINQTECNAGNRYQGRSSGSLEDMISGVNRDGCTVTHTTSRFHRVL